MMKKIIYLAALFSLLAFWVQAAGDAPAAGDAKKGEEIFKANCASCHSPFKKVTGPALKGATGRWGNNLDELTAFVQNSTDYIKSSRKNAAYAKKLFAEFNNTTMTGFGTLTKADVADIFAYVEAAKEPVAAKPVEAKGEGGGAGISASTLFYGAAALVGILLLILLVVIILIAVIARAVQNKEEGKKISGTDLQEAVLNLARSPFTVGLVVLLVGAGVVNGAYEYLWHINLHDNYQPAQPIKFSHALHAGQNKIDCKYCHVGAEKGKSAMIPSANICTNCHKEGGVEDGPKYGKDEIAKVILAAKENKPVEWVRIHNLPDLVYFNHSQHVKVAGLECQECHGPVEKMEEVYQYSRLSMGWCVNCHRTKEVDIDKNDYYRSVHQQLREEKKTSKDMKITVEKLGGLECARCHY